MAFDLLKSLNGGDDSVVPATKKNDTPSIVYQQYIIENKYAQQYKLNIPMRESENFESRVNELDDITYDDINQLLREFRGILVD